MTIVVLSIAAGLFAVVLLLGWALLRIARQQSRVRRRLDGVERRLTMLPVRAVAPAGLLDQVAPPFELLDLAGCLVSLAALRVKGNPVLLIFAEPLCGPCYELLRDAGGWQRLYGDRITVAVVSTGSPDQNRAMTAEYGLHSVLLQREREILSAYAIAQEPSGVLIRPDGTIGNGPLYGVNAVRRLVAGTLGLELPNPPARSLQPVAMGQTAPVMRRPDLDGVPVELSNPDRFTLLIFWNPGCAYCRQILPEVRRWTGEPAMPRLLIVSRGPAALNRAASIAAPIVLDDDRTITRTFGVAGTPSAVLIDRTGIVASRVARGVDGVRALAVECLHPVHSAVR